MAKNNFLKNVFKSKTKEEKALAKLKKMKTEYDKLEQKFMSGTIAHSELERYNNLSEEINKMAKKFAIKNGKLILNKEQPAEASSVKNPETVIKNDENIVKQQMAAQQAQQAEQMKAYKEAVMRAQQQAAIPQPNPQMLHEEEQAREYAQMKAQHDEQLRAQDEAQMRAQQAHDIAQHNEQLRAQDEAQMRAQQEEFIETQQPSMASATGEEIIHVFLTDLPELKLTIRSEDKKTFIDSIDKAIVDGTVFRFGPYNLNPQKIMMYTFS